MSAERARTTAPERSAAGPAIRRDPVALVSVWGARVVWVALAVVGGAAFGDALADRSRAVQVTGTVGLWVGWAVVALALLVPSTVGLTVVRTLVPIGLVAALVAAVEGDDTVHRALLVGLVLLALALVATGELGQLFAQASAYGDEHRFVLRPPVPYLLPVAMSWAALCAASIVGPLALAARAWSVGVPVTAIAVLLGWYLARRYHRLARRWVVIVPAGVVVHDHLVLAETAMFPKRTLVRIGLALEGTQAADLTGPAAGHAVEIAVNDAPTVVLAPTKVTPGGRALHVRAALVAPSRPGRFLAEAARRGFPVG